MKLTILSVFIFLFLSMTINNTCTQEGSICNVKLHSVYDGDTFYINLKNIPELLGRKLPIRIKGVDTPEIRTKNECEKKKAILAKFFTYEKLNKAEKVNLYNCERGKYFRLVCSVNVDGKDLTEILIISKMGIAYNGEKKPKMDWCKF